MKEGFYTLQQETQLVQTHRLSEVSQLNQWIFETIQPWVRGKILELGSGSGNISEVFAQKGMSLRLSDPNASYCSLLEKRFEGTPMIKGVHSIQLSQTDFQTIYYRFLGRFDTVIFLNTVEHIPLNEKAIINAKYLLREGGYLIFLAPADTALYNELNYGFDEWRSENHKILKKLVGKDLHFRKIKFFNVIGMLGWYLSNLGTNPFPSNAPAINNLYKQQVPSFLIADEILFHRIGLSVIAIAKKTTQE